MTKKEMFCIKIATVEEAESLKDALETCFLNEKLFLKSEMNSLEKIYNKLMDLK